MHLPGYGSSHKDLAKCRVSYHEELDVELSKPDNQEPPVAMDALENVELWLIFFTKLSAIEHVEEIHHHEGLEEEGVM